MVNEMIFYGATSQTGIAQTIRHVCGILSGKTAYKAFQMVIGTACAETGLGTYRDNYLAEGRGLYQFDTIRVVDICEYILRNSELHDKIDVEFGFKVSDYCFHEGEYLNVDKIMCVLDLSPLASTVLCRVGYMMKPEPLPKVDDTQAQAEYWKKHWNTEAGKGTVNHYLAQNKRHYGGAVNV